MIKTIPLLLIFLIVANTAQAQNHVGAPLCQIPKPAQIKIVPKSKKLVIDTSRSMAQIQKKEMGTINPYGYNSVSHTNGYMEAEIGMQSLVKLDSKPLQRVGAYCLWYDEVRVEINIAPKIVIAKEVARDKCMYKAVLAHEKKHVSVDRKIINQFAKNIGAKIHDGLKQRGFIAGPIAPEHVEVTAARMRKTVEQLFEFESKKMEIDRAEAQQGVDSLEEYKFVQAKCPDYVPPDL